MPVVVSGTRRDDGDADADADEERSLQKSVARRLYASISSTVSTLSITVSYAAVALANLSHIWHAVRIAVQTLPCSSRAAPRAPL